ncbi:hypothetical protein K4K61_000524 [Colletotrichum sp. SAR11_59]|nr:hypothetical protein K4K61_000524 [Colletotrichum sp. SAR11_59]
MTKEFFESADVPAEQTWMYEKELPEGYEASRALLRDYSGIPAGEMDNHIRRIRDSLWKVFHYPCIGRWRFLLLADPQDALYQKVLGRLTQADSGDTLLDLGTCVGQALRQLAHDGVDSSRLYGADVQREFLDIGYDLFRDKGRFRGTLVAGDVLDPADTGLSVLNGQISIIWANAFFHLFDWKQQVMAAERIIKFLKPGLQDGLVFGRHLGTTEPKESDNRGRRMYLHDQDSFQHLWDEVGAKTGTKWKVWWEHVAAVDSLPGFGDTARMSRDIHIYHFQNNPDQVKHAKDLWERIRREFPELRIYRFWEKPVGPHPVAMFEVNLFTPAQFGAFIPWLAIYRGPLSVLVHPNTDEEGNHNAIELRNHTQRAIWMGERIPLDTTLFYRD